MKKALARGALLLAALVVVGCSSSASQPRTSSSSSSSSARCLSRPDTSGTQPLIYLLCIQTN